MTEDDNNMNDITSVESSTSSLTTQAFRRIYSMIIQGELKPGEKLKIESLRNTLGVGASPLREALSLLTSEQLIEHMDQRGFRVSHINAEAFDELLKTRCWLEERALRESMRAKDEVWEERVLLAHHRLKRPLRTLDDGTLNPEWEERHKAFHMSLLSACGSSILIKMCNQLFDQNIRYRNVSGIYVSANRKVGNEHDAIVEYVLSGQEEKAVNELLSHYHKTGKLLSDFLKKKQESEH